MLALLAQLAVLLPVGRSLPDGAAALATYAAATLFVWGNRRVPGLLLIAAGAVCNGVAIALNGGVRPASASALALAGIERAPATFSHTGVIPRPRLAFLGDVFAVPAGVPLAGVFSVGDVLIVLAAGYAACRICGTFWSAPWDAVRHGHAYRPRGRHRAAGSTHDLRATRDEQVTAGRRAESGRTARRTATGRRPHRLTRPRRTGEEMQPAGAGEPISDADAVPADPASERINPTAWPAANEQTPAVVRNTTTAEVEQGTAEVEQGEPGARELMALFLTSDPAAGAPVPNEPPEARKAGAAAGTRKLSRIPWQRGPGNQTRDPAPGQVPVLASESAHPAGPPPFLPSPATGHTGDVPGRSGSTEGTGDTAGTGYPSDPEGRNAPESVRDPDGMGGDWPEEVVQPSRPTLPVQPVALTITPRKGRLGPRFRSG